MKKISLLFLLFLGCPITDTLLLNRETCIDEAIIKEISSRFSPPSGDYKITYSSDVYYSSGNPVNKIILYTSHTPYLLEEGETLKVNIKGEVYAFFLDIRKDDNFGTGILKFKGDSGTFYLSVNPYSNCIDVGEYMENFCSSAIIEGTHMLSFTSSLTTGYGEVKRCIVYNTTDYHPYGWFWVLEKGKEIEIDVTGEGEDAEYIYATFISSGSVEGTGEIKIK